MNEGDAGQAAKVLERRLDGVDGASAREADSTRVVVELPKDRARALVPVLVSPGKLALYDLQGQLVPPSIDAQGFPVATTDPGALPEDAVVLRCGVAQRYCPGVNEESPTRTYYYAVQGKPKLTGADFDREETRQDFDTRTNEPIVLLAFTDEGARRFHDVTRELAMRGRLMSQRGVPIELAFQQFAIVLDGVLMSAPTIDFHENPDGIPGDSGAQISGIGSVAEARNLAAVLRGGELEARLAVARGSDAEVEN